MDPDTSPTASSLNKTKKREIRRSERGHAPPEQLLDPAAVGRNANLAQLQAVQLVDGAARARGSGGEGQLAIRRRKNGGQGPNVKAGGGWDEGAGGWAGGGGERAVAHSDSFLRKKSFVRERAHSPWTGESSDVISATFAQHCSCSCEPSGSRSQIRCTGCAGGGGGRTAGATGRIAPGGVGNQLAAPLEDAPAAAEEEARTTACEQGGRAAPDLRHPRFIILKTALLEADCWRSPISPRPFFAG